MFRIIETFSGIGAQAKALERIGKEFEVVHTAEWDINAILAYCLIHKKEIDFSQFNNLSEEDLNKQLCSFTLSFNGKEPATQKQLCALPVDFKKKLLGAIEQTKNFVSITDIKGSQIPENIDLFTYSFPCQDLSLCGAWHGNNSGISRNAHNRSGMLWEVERILLEMYKLKRKLPKYLVMENVTNIMSPRHKDDFDDWKNTLEKLGYYNKVYKLDAQNFGICQHRCRAYMISVFCGENTNVRSQVRQFFNRKDLEKYSGRITRKVEGKDVPYSPIWLKDVLKINYKKEKYLLEAEACNPNNTPSRQKIYEENDHLYDGTKPIKNRIVKTLTTKQDRNPNSGLIDFCTEKEGKAQWRYLTPRECFLLMGFDESDFDMLVDNNLVLRKNKLLFTTEKLTKMAGNSIVVPVLEALFTHIFELENELQHLR